MANHGYVKTGKTLYPEQVEKIALEVIKKHKLTSLKFTTKDENGKPHWILWVDEYNAVQFWIGDETLYEEKNGDWVASGKIPNSVVEFRHGHGLSIMWWMEQPFMYAFKKAFDGKIYDDCCENEFPGHDETFIEYMDRLYPEVKGIKKLKPENLFGKRNQFRDHDMKFLPEQLIIDLNLKKI